MLLKYFVIHKKLVDKVLLWTLKFEHVFCYSNLHEMFSNLLWALIYFIRRATCVYIFKCTCIESFKWMLLILILNVFNGQKNYTFDYNLNFMQKNIVFIII
jgi:hypothetical protein